MKTSVFFCIALQGINCLVTLIIKKATDLFKIITSLSKIIIIYKVVSCVIRWVYVNHLYLAEISFTKHLQHFQVVPFNIKILSIIKIHRLLTARTQSLCSSFISKS